ncbi:hypothetical protein CYOC110262_23975 [Cytobacillus oceanisediminis]|uniref:Uncharacterized protein n=1 Tax=Cytobacillus oceanisediminis TaxID=665099 RepID=A0A562K6H6_9BACI|nr:hypothetical protein IQ19_00479 [Cytobacillus oceanisediminis]
MHILGSLFLFLIVLKHPLVEEEVFFNSLVAFSYTSLLVHLVQGYYLISLLVHLHIYRL